MTITQNDLIKDIVSEVSEVTDETTTVAETVETVVEPIEAIEQKEVKLSGTLASQIALMKTQVLDLTSALQLATDENVKLSEKVKQLEADAKAIADSKVEVEQALIEKQKEVAGFETTVAQLQETVEKQNKIIDLKEIKEITQGTEPVAIELSGEGKTILQTYEGLKGQKQFEFFQQHKGEILKAWKNQ